MLPPVWVVDVVELGIVVGAAVGGVVGGEVGGEVGGTTMTVGGLVGGAVGGTVTSGSVVVVLVEVELLEVDELLVEVRSGTLTLVVSSPLLPLETANAMPDQHEHARDRGTPDREGSLQLRIHRFGHGETLPTPTSDRVSPRPGPCGHWRRERPDGLVTVGAGAPGSLVGTLVRRDQRECP